MVHQRVGDSTGLYTASPDYLFFLRSGFTAYVALSRGDEFCCPRHLADDRKAWRQLRAPDHTILPYADYARRARDNRPCDAACVHRRSPRVS